jgi:hypothetical protein
MLGARAIGVPDDDAELKKDQFLLPTSADAALLGDDMPLASLTPGIDSTD